MQRPGEIPLGNLALVALLATGVALALVPGGPPPVTSPSLVKVERAGRPWLVAEVLEPTGVVFEMQSSAQREIIGVSSRRERVHALELEGWLGPGKVMLRARPDGGPEPPPLALDGSEVRAHLDRLALEILAGDRSESWSRLGRFADLYFGSKVADAGVKQRLQALLARGGAEDGPGGSAWLWGATGRSHRVPLLPGAREIEAIPPEDPRLDPRGATQCLVELPEVPSAADLELGVTLELAPTPAPGLAVTVELETGWWLRLEPGPEGGAVYQRLDPRALSPGGTGARFRLVAPAGSPKGVRASVARVVLRYLPEPIEGDRSGA